MRRSSLSLKNCFRLSKQTRPPQDGSAWSRLTAITGADLNEVYIIGTTSPKGQWREVFK